MEEINIRNSTEKLVQYVVNFRISEESLGLNEVKENSCAIFKSEILFFQRRHQRGSKLEDRDGYQGIRVNLKFGRLR